MKELFEDAVKINFEDGFDLCMTPLLSSKLAKKFQKHQQFIDLLSFSIIARPAFILQKFWNFYDP